MSQVVLVHIGPSILPGAGKGIFANYDIAKGSVVADYGGIWVGSRRSLRTPPSLNSDYHYGLLYQVPNGAFISATLDGHPSHFRPNQPEYLAHMANDAIHPTATGFENNCHLDESVCGNCRSVGQVVRSARVQIIAGRDIKAGEEILVSYGLQYWIKSYVPAMPSRTRDWLHVHELMESVIRMQLQDDAWEISRYDGCHLSFSTTTGIRGESVLLYQLKYVEDGRRSSIRVLTMEDTSALRRSRVMMLR
eukprot:gene20466-27255_t